jgi:DNA-binding winged helix-turn-helix (wHTH) protein
VKVLFGEWTLDSETRQVLHASKQIHLSTKAFDLLKLLIEARPRVVSKGELQDALWPGIFVSETNLFSLISEIRAAIEDEARHPRFVRTVHGIGYAFSGDARDVAGTVAARGTTAVCVLVWEGRQYSLAEGEHLIGRDSDIAVTLESTTISRRHACLRVTKQAATIQDLGSKNGTFLNDERVAGEMEVADGDRIRVGSVLTTFRRVGPASSTETEHVKTDPDEPW